jgi:UDP-N-acetylmuramoyl-tripeptide--D-alanyl-D-alanine ligase
MTPFLTLREVQALLPEAALFGDAQTGVSRVHTDTRTIEPGDLFVALRGERFDANTMLHEAQSRGAAAVLCHTGLEPGAYPDGLPRIEVMDTKQALASLATGWRARFSIPVIAVTGSNGKTTVTQMVASVLHTHAPDGGALATVGNFNNDIGVPLTLMRLRPHHRIAVVELGMNHPGEIAGLAAMAQPTVALVNNAQREHLEFMHTVEAVARENGCVLSALPASGVAVYPADDAHADVWRDLAKGRQVTEFTSASQGAQVCLTDARWDQGAWHVVASTPQGALVFRLAIAGRHNVKNALAAAACALSAGVPLDTVQRGLESFEPVKGRCRAMQVAHETAQFTLVDDTYNANPDSMRAAIDVLADLPGPRLLIMGDMGEVGAQGPAFHAEAGQYARDAGIEHVLTLGELAMFAASAAPAARHFGAVEDLITAAHALAPEVSSVLVKGSRFMRMERVVNALMAAPAPKVASHAA